MLLHEERLEGVNNDLCRVVRRCAELFDGTITVSEGLRTKERQKELFAAGKSQTLNSKHISGKAVDLYSVDSKRIIWGDCEKLAKTMKRAAWELGIEIICGIDWKMFRDSPHFELK